MEVELRDLAPGERRAVAFDERVTLHVDGQPVDAPARGEARIERTGRGARLGGRVEARVPLVCSRCLQPFTAALAADRDEEFLLGAGPEPHGGELGPDDFVQYVGADQPLDLSEVVRQHLQMAVPIAPLHSPTCRGLCPVCGTNWNERACGHLPSARR